MWSPYQAVGFLLPIYTCAANAIPSPAIPQSIEPTTSGLQNVAQNLTLTQSIPSAFSIAPNGDPGQVLRNFTCLQVALDTLGIMAARDFNGTQGYYWRTRPGIKIAFDTQDHRGLVPRKYAIWGLYSVMAYMVSENDFRARNFTLSWEKVGLGSIAFTPYNYDNPGLANDSDVPTSQTDTTLIGEPLTTPFNAINASQGATALSAQFQQGNLSYVIAPSGSPRFQPSEIYMTIASAVVHAAPLPATQRILDFDVNCTDFRSRFLLKDWHPDSAPFLEKWMMLKVLVQIPMVLLLDDYWSQVIGLIQIKTQTVAFFSLKDISQEGAADPGVNGISIS